MRRYGFVFLLLCNIPVSYAMIYHMQMHFGVDICKNRTRDFLENILANPNWDVNKPYRVMAGGQQYPAQLACRYEGFTPYFKALLERGANYEITFDGGRNVFHQCALHNSTLDNVNVLIEHAHAKGIHLAQLLACNTKLLGTPLHIAGGKRDAQMYLLFLKQGTPINCLFREKTALAHFFTHDPYASPAILNVVTLPQTLEVIEASAHAGITSENLITLRTHIESRIFHHKRAYLACIDCILVLRALTTLRGDQRNFVNWLPADLIPLLVGYYRFTMVPTSPRERKGGGT